MTLLLNKAHFPVEVLGHGRRVGLWLQGCTIRCFGCISRDTWVADPNTAIEVPEVLAWIADLPDGTVDGVTISGGEPFDQADALAELLDALGTWRATQSQPVDLLSYSGRSLDVLEQDFAPLLARLDAVVPEPYIQGAPTRLALRGSANQSLVALSPLGVERYTGAALLELEAQRDRMQVEVDGESIWFIGIPEQGTMSRVRTQAAEAGIGIGRPSWLI